MCEREPQNVHDRCNIKYAVKYLSLKIFLTFYFHHCRLVLTKKVNENFTIYGMYHSRV